MKVPAVLMTDHLGEVASSLDASESIVVENLPVMGDVSTSAAYLEYRAATDPEAPHRPYLHIIGQVDEVRGGFPHGVTTATVTNGVPVDIFYEFTDKELADMTLKGMYRRGFEAPVELLRYPMVDLPMACNVQAFMEEQSGIPIMFIEIVDAHDMVMDRASSGYTLGDYFKEPVARTDFDSQFDSQFDTIDVSKFDFDNAFKSFEQPTAEPEPAPELTDEQRALIEHYVNVSQRVTDLHLEGQLTADDIMGRDELDRVEIEPMALDIEPVEMGEEAVKQADEAKREHAVREAIELLEKQGGFKIERVGETVAKVLGHDAVGDAKTLADKPDAADEGFAVDDPKSEMLAAFREKQRIAREAAAAAIERHEVAEMAATTGVSAADTLEPGALDSAFVDVEFHDVDAPETGEPFAPPVDDGFAAIDDAFAAQFADMGDMSFDINSVLKDEPAPDAPEPDAPEPDAPEPDAAAPGTSAERKRPSVAPSTVPVDPSASPDM